MEPASQSARVFISYRSQDPDLSLAKEFYDALKAAGHEPFMAGMSIRFGQKWPQRIDEELERADYFLLLLSAQSVASEIVTEEVRRARELRNSRPEGKPIILPIRVCFPMSAPLNYDLCGYLYQLQQREWNSPSDTPVLIEELLTLLTEESREMAVPKDLTEESQTAPATVESFDRPPLPVAEPELPGGQVDLASAFYVKRPPIEARCFEAIAKPGALIRIKAPRQMGKTSLMARVLQQAEAQGCLKVPLSFQLADGKVFADLDKFLQWFCASIGRRLKLPNQIKEYWDDIY